MNLATAANALRRIPAFRNVSLRLLEDLIEQAEGFDVDSDTPKRLSTFFVLSTHGDVVVEPDISAASRFSHRHKITRGQSCHCHGEFVQVRAARGRSGGVLTMHSDQLRDLLGRSSSLARGLQLSVAGGGGAGRAEAASDGFEATLSDLASLPHCLLLTEADGLNAPLEALAHLLAAALERFLHEAAIVMTADGSDLKVNQSFHHASCNRSCRTESYSHIIVVLPFSQGRPKYLRGSFHRIVYVCLSAPSVDEIPPDLLTLLKPGLFDSNGRRGPYFSSFVTTVIAPTSGAGRDRSRRSMPAPVPYRGLQTLATEKLSEPAAAATRVTGLDAEQRLRRDRCILRLDLQDLEQHWREAPTLDAFVARAPIDPGLCDSVFRWARAVTNRQVGLALSGGGATQAALVPFLDRLLAANVPIDVVSGVSGGSLLGAYLCTRGRRGLQTYLNRGLFFQVGLGLATVHSGFIEFVIDQECDGVTLGELEIRFVPVTTVLADGKQPEGHAIVGGTVGEAVRASSAAPSLFGPAQYRDKRYLDGGSTLPVPARHLPEYGADLVFACNSIGRPSVRNPLRDVLPGLGEVLYRYTLVGRVIDYAVAFFLMLDGASAEAAEDADHFYAAPPERLPLVSGFFWANAEAMAKSAAKRSECRAAAEACIRRWREMAGLESYP